MASSVASRPSPLAIPKWMLFANFQRAEDRAAVLPDRCRRSVRHRRVGAAHGRDQGRERRGDLRADGLRDSRRPGASWPPTSSSASTSTARSARPSARRSVRQLVDRVTRTIADWGTDDGYFATRRRRRAVLRRADLALPAPVRLVQLARLVQRRPVPPATASTGRPSQLALGRGDARDRRAARERRTSTRKARPASSRASPTTWKTSCGWPRSEAMLFKFGSRHGHRPLDPSLAAARSSPAAASPRGPLSASCGSTTRSPRREVGRQDPPRRQDADAQGLAPRHPRIHRVQDQGGEEGPDA